MDSALVDVTSQEFLGQWKLLVSTTNWEKGHIIWAWRQALSQAGAPSWEYSDDAWSRRVGHVTPQHVGRLRRVYERFAQVHNGYAGLYWSHFQAALDWDDAEMWLEGAVQNGWSISEMRQTRFEVSGEVVGDSSAPPDDVEWDEDAEPIDEIVVGTIAEVRAPDQKRAQDVDDPSDLAVWEESSADDMAAGDEADSTAEREVPRRATLPSLPPDVADAFESYKLCILRHKLAGWLEISASDMLASLAALEQLVLAPAEH